MNINAEEIISMLRSQCQRKEADAAKRKQYYQDAQKILVDSSASIVPFFADRIIGLSKKVGLDRSTTGLVIKKLEADALIVRVDDPKDRRRKVIVLTARGERKLDRLRGPAARAQEHALAAFEPEEAREFLLLLNKFVQHFNGITRAPITDE